MGTPTAGVSVYAQLLLEASGRDLWAERCGLLRFEQGEQVFCGTTRFNETTYNLAGAIVLSGWALRRWTPIFSERSGGSRAWAQLRRKR